MLSTHATLAPLHHHQPGSDGDNQRRNCRVLYLLSDLGGGTGNHLLSMSRLLDKSAVSAELLSLANRTSRVRPEIPVTVYKPSGMLNRYPFTQLRCLQYIRRYLNGRSIDIVHSYFFWPIIYARLLKLAGRISHLVENREDQGFDWGHHEYALLRMTRHIPDAVICVAEAVRTTALNKEGLDPARVCVVHNGIAPDVSPSADPVALRRKLKLADNAPMVGMVANLNRAVKGGPHFIQSLPDIVRAVPQARFVVVGEADEGKLRRQARALGVDQFVVFAGVQTNMHDFYAVFDVSVLASLSEGLSMTILESMNHGVPVVATDVGGNREIILNGETGFLVPPRSPRELAAKVITVLTQPALRSRLGRAAQSRVLRHFALQSAANQYSALYQRVIGTGTNSSNQWQS